MLGVIQPAFGAVVILGIAVACSNNRRAINWRTVAWGLGLQILFAPRELAELLAGLHDAAHIPL